MADNGDKTESATPKRRQDERKKGNIHQSHEIVTAVSLIVGFYAVKLMMPIILTTLQTSIKTFFDLAATTDSLVYTDLQRFFVSGCRDMVFTALPLLLVTGVITIIATVAQTRGLVSFDKIKFKPSKMSPLKGLKKMFALSGLVEMFKSILKIAILAAIIYNVLIVQMPLMPRMMDMDLMQVLAMSGQVVLTIVKNTAIIFAFVAVADYLYQWWSYEKSLRMSKQEIKEEYKQVEGDPKIKGKIKERQQAMSRQRMMQSVPTADVVIRNPTHYAIAIRYEPEKNNAPMVVAKGADLVALKIIEIAEENNVTMVENKPLARGLYETVELDHEIPDQFYQPVAEVLAFVYSLKKKKELN